MNFHQFTQIKNLHSHSPTLIPAETLALRSSYYGDNQIRLSQSQRIIVQSPSFYLPCWRHSRRRTHLRFETKCARKCQNTHQKKWVNTRIFYYAWWKWHSSNNSLWQSSNLAAELKKGMKNWDFQFLKFLHKFCEWLVWFSKRKWLVWYLLFWNIRGIMLPQ